MNDTRGTRPDQLLKSFKVLDGEINAGYKETIKEAFSFMLGIDPQSVRIEHDRNDSRYTKLAIPVLDNPAFKERMHYVQHYDSHAGLPTQVTIINNKANIRIADSNLKEITDAQIAVKRGGKS